MDNDKFVAMMEKQYSENAADTIKVIAGFLNSKLMSQGDAARHVGVSIKTFDMYFSDDLNENDTVNFELSNIAKSGAIENSLWRGKRYMSDVMEVLASRRKEIYGDAKRIRRTTPVTKSMVIAFAETAGKTLPESAKSAGEMVDALAALLAVPSEALTAAIERYDAQRREMLNSLIVGAVTSLTKTE